MYLQMDKRIIIPVFALLVLMAGCVQPHADQDVSFPSSLELQNLVRDFNWEGQFEDQEPADRYKNLSKGQACSYAQRLLDYPYQVL